MCVPLHTKPHTPAEVIRREIWHLLDHDCSLHPTSSHGCSEFNVIKQYGGCTTALPLPLKLQCNGKVIQNTKRKLIFLDPKGTGLTVRNVAPKTKVWYVGLCKPASPHNIYYYNRTPLLACTTRGTGIARLQYDIIKVAATPTTNKPRINK